MNDVPAELSSFVGRVEELAQLGGLVAAGRVLTLVGPGGCGKTRLAQCVTGAAGSVLRTSRTPPGRGRRGGRSAAHRPGRVARGARYPNLRAAVEWGLSRPDPTPGRRLAAGVAWLWHLGQRGHEGLRLLRRAVALGRDERTALQAECLVALALVADTTEPGWQGYEAAHAARVLANEVGAAATSRLARSLAAVGLVARTSTWPAPRRCAPVTRRSRPATRSRRPPPPAWSG